MPVNSQSALHRLFIPSTLNHIRCQLTAKGGNLTPAMYRKHKKMGTEETVPWTKRAGIKHRHLMIPSQKSFAKFLHEEEVVVKK